MFENVIMGNAAHGGNNLIAPFYRFFRKGTAKPAACSRNEPYSFHEISLLKDCLCRRKPICLRFH